MWRKKEYQHLRIKQLKKQEGQISLVIGLFFTVMIGIFLCGTLQLMQFRVTGAYVEDALAASNLAAAIIDTQGYSKDHLLRFEDVWKNYNIYRNALAENLNLDADFVGKNQGAVTGKVNIEAFILYEVLDDKVRSIAVSSDGKIVEEWGTKGMVCSPNHIVIENASVYSEISFVVKGFAKVEATVHKGKLVDIVSEGEKE